MQLRQINPTERIALADALGDSAETVISVHQLRRGLAKAFLLGDPPGSEGFRAAIVQNIADPSEPMAFGDDPEAVWSILQSLDGWTCVQVECAIADRLERLLIPARGGSVRRLEDVYHVLTAPVPEIGHPLVRPLSITDADLVAGTPPGLFVPDWSFGSPELLLNEGFAAGAIAAGELVLYFTVTVVATLVLERPLMREALGYLR